MTPGKIGINCDYSGTGCQSGSCVNGTATTSSVVSTSTGGISSDGTCGYSSAYNCEGSSYGDCCSCKTHWSDSNEMNLIF